MMTILLHTGKSLMITHMLSEKRRPIKMIEGTYVFSQK